MSAPIPIKFKLTNAGRLAALDAFNSGLNLKLTEVAIGTGKYNSETTGANRTTLQNEIGRYPLSGGSIEPVSQTLRFSAILESGITQNAFEVGLFDEHGVLFAVASTTSNDPLILVTANIAFVAAFSLVLTDVNVTNITVVDDPSSPLAIALMNQHVANADPHPQYPLKTALANAIWHVGYRFMTGDASYNPATALEPLFGYQTTWYLWPYVPAGVANTSAALGQIIPLTAGNDTQAATTRIWERLPDGASAPTYTLTASKNSVDEGEQVTFNLTTTGIAQGTAVAWNITGIQAADITPNALTGQFVVGADGKASKTITIVNDEVTEGTETLKFALTYITGKFVNVTINDTSIQLEQIVTISSNRSSGLNLREAFVAVYGQPTDATKAVFVVESGVEIIAPDTTTAAIYGDTWPTGSTREVRVLSGAKVLGRGGKGGQAIDYDDSPASKTGETGGTAIRANSGVPIIVNNYGLIAGGGGGGGASGIASVYANSQHQLQNSAMVVPGTGGAPLGLNSPLSKNRLYDKVAGETTWSGRNLLSDNGDGTRMVWYYDKENSNSTDAWHRILEDGQQNVNTPYSSPPIPWIQVSASDTTPTATIPMDLQVGDLPYTQYLGGRGGFVGENGNDGGITVGGPVSGTEQRVYIVGGNGGLAGYIYQGSVIINNLSGGETKGRTP